MISLQELTDRIAGASATLLLLDYDGTIAEFSPTPGDRKPNPAVLEVLRLLAATERLDVCIVSGRDIDSLAALIPVAGITIVGGYGIEAMLPNGSRLIRGSYDEVRPFLDRVKPSWNRLISGLQGFYLEDKRWSVALHGRHARRSDAELVFTAAQEQLEELEVPPGFRVLGGDRFVEVAPRAASKREAVEYLAGRMDGPEGWIPVYLGDDDKDAEAFEAVRRLGGYTVLVGKRRLGPEALPDCRFSDPSSARAWLRALADRLSA